MAALLAILALTALVEFAFTDEQIDHLSMRTDVHLGSSHANLLDVITDAEIHEGFVRFVGTKYHGAGSVDLLVSAEDDVLNIKIIEVIIPGISLDDPIIVEANQELEYELTLLADPDAEVLFKEVVVEEGVMRMQIQVNVNCSLDHSILIDIPLKSQDFLR